ncbi:phage tail protein [Pyramidobacter sp.]|uniref:phage tail protein n=1 Tax=Pyramidobacter sp. TaxID=1943581 RepID=UPI0025DF836E|nr:phage tail protein [Pyramidobacter sp.]MCI7403746.1 phage tail protein [Pyramidobacter sp.]MDY3211375.1 phage tail protein [Pyramidobacter sp.]
MPKALFAPPVMPSSISSSQDVRTLKSGFGDEYVQVMTDGINAVRESLSLTWETLTFAEITAISGFFSTQKSRSFRWRYPGSAKEKLWRCEKWSIQYQQTHANLSATFTEVFA